jgi:hypothetical protein
MGGGMTVTITMIGRGMSAGALLVDAEVDPEVLEVMGLDEILELSVPFGEALGTIGLLRNRSIPTRMNLEEISACNHLQETVPLQRRLVTQDFLDARRVFKMRRFGKHHLDQTVTTIACH